MTKRLPLLFLAAAAGLLAFGGVMHARAFGKAALAVASSSLPEFYGNSLKALWLIDSATLLVLAAVFAFVAVRPVAASGTVLGLLALIPGATSVLLYTFMGMFLPAHMFLAAAILTAAAGALRVVEERGEAGKASAR
jgi:hypothetical protein